MRSSPKVGLCEIEDERRLDRLFQVPRIFNANTADPAPRLVDPTEQMVLKHSDFTAGHTGVSNVRFFPLDNRECSEV